nr:hypothetical protein Iba_chr05dCG18230 [Ipomoea batatas]
MLRLMKPDTEAWNVSALLSHRGSLSGALRSGSSSAIVLFLGPLPMGLAMSGGRRGISPFVTRLVAGKIVYLSLDLRKNGDMVSIDSSVNSKEVIIGPGNGNVAVEESGCRRWLWGFFGMAVVGRAFFVESRYSCMISGSTRQQAGPLGSDSCTLDPKFRQEGLLRTHNGVLDTVVEKIDMDDNVDESEWDKSVEVGFDHQIQNLMT